METPTTTYRGVVITYAEDRNKWTFELRGSQRWADTLTNAKAVIDKPAPKDKKAFAPIEAYYTSYDGEFSKVRVTSIAEKSRWSRGTYFWVVNGKKERTKVENSRLYIVSPDNDAKIQQRAELKKQIDALEEARDAIVLDTLQLPHDVETGDEAQ